MEETRKNIRLGMHNHREGGSMICDDRKEEFDALPTEKEIKGALRKYRFDMGLNSEERVFMNLS